MNTGMEDKIALVTGASGGIGSAVTRLLAAEGADVVIHYHRGSERAEEVRSQLPAATKSLLVCGDLTDEEQVETLFIGTEGELGTPNILIANAGVWPTENTPISEMSLKRWTQTLENNLTSVFLCCRAFLKFCELASIEDPAIVMVGSTAGHFGEADHGDYAAAKSGLMGGLLQSLKNEIPRTAPRGRINAVCPGWTMTPMAQKFQDNQDAMTRALQTIPMRKFASPEDIAKAVLFFASNEMSGHVTGQTLFVSGGMEGRVLNSVEELQAGNDQ